MKIFLSSKRTLLVIVAILLLVPSIDAQVPSMGNPYTNPLSPRPYPAGHRPPMPSPLKPEHIELAKKLLREHATDIRARAHKGDYKAQYNLGVIHIFGAGATLDFKQAFDNFRKSAEKTVYAPATFNLAICYAQGLGTEIDRVQAYKWWNLAATQGHPMAAQARDNIAKYLNRQQIAVAQRMGRGYAKTLDSRFKMEKLKAIRNQRNQSATANKALNPDDAAYRLSRQFYRNQSKSSRHR